MTLTASTTVTMKSFQGTCGYLYNCPPFEAASEDCPLNEEKSETVERSVSYAKPGVWHRTGVQVCNLVGGTL